MAKITRKLQKLFGSTAGSNQIAKYGSLAAGSPVRYTGAAADPDNIQALSQYLSGWLSAVDGGNSPAIEDMNALCWLFSRQIAYILQTGVPEWNSGTTYYIGSIVNEDGVLYKSKTDDNINNALTDLINWEEIKFGIDVVREVILREWSTRRGPTTSAQTGSPWTSICFSPELNRFVAVANSASPYDIAYSDDGYQWTGVTNPSSADVSSWESVCWADSLSLFVAVATLNTATAAQVVMTSPDGITWTIRTGVAKEWYTVCWSPDLNLLVAGNTSDTSNPFMTSSNGTAWTLRSATAHASSSIAWSPSLALFVSVGSGTNSIMTSPDGTTWTIRTAPSAHYYRSVCWSPELNLFVAVGYSTVTPNGVITSPDGITWTQRTDAGANSWTGVTWSSSLGAFVAVSATVTAGVQPIMSSYDGITWTLRNSAFTYTTTNTYSDICWSEQFKMFVGCGSINFFTSGPSASTSLLTWKTVHQASASHTAGKTAGTYSLTAMGDPALISGTGAAYPISLFHLDESMLNPINGSVPLYRLKVIVSANDVAPTGTYVFGLYPITRPATSGAAGVCIYTIGTLVTDSETTGSSTIAADALSIKYSSVFTIPTVGMYGIAVLTTGTVAASSHMVFNATLEVCNH